MPKEKNRKSILRLRLSVLLPLICLTLFSAEAQTKQKYRGKAKPKVAYHTPNRKAMAHLPAATTPVSNLTVVRSKAAFTFTNRWYDFGDVVQGQKISHTFGFRNTGKEPLIISNVQPTCGCTVTEWTRQPIVPGQQGQIAVTFDSKAAINEQNRTITVISNSMGGSERLYLKGNVLPKR